MSDQVYLGRGFWPVPPLWAGDTVLILGGGPSLADLAPRLDKGPLNPLPSWEGAGGGGASRVRVLAINDAFLLAPWADALYFCDLRWWHGVQNRPHLKRPFDAFPGLVVTLDNLQLRDRDPRIRCLANMGWDEKAGHTGLFDRPWGVFHGRNSGYQAIHLAVHAGARRILLAGYDMRPAPDGRANWHRNHETPANPGAYDAVMLPSFPFLAAACAARGVEVINVTPGSALTAFPAGRLEDHIV
ncbi:MAG: hypothetical protein AB7F67_03880 [Rhodospirillaceae bacterium]